MEAFSYALFWAGFVSVSGAAASYVTLVVWRRQTIVSGATPVGTASIALPGVAPAGLRRVGTLMAWFAAAFLVASLVSRAAAAGRPPWGNMWEYTETLGFGVTLAYLMFERRNGQPMIGAFVLPVVVALFAIAEIWLPHEIAPLMPALQNNRLLAIHVASMIVAYSVLAVAFGAAVVYLAQGEGNRFASLPSAEDADEVGHKAVMLGFPILGLGIVLGAYWGNIAWARAWGWDPKETTALASWLIYAGYLHARALGKWRGHRTALISILGFATIIFNIFVVNFVISGLHSYAGA